jgi:putative multiple sugar transport system substrate-binding protein
MVVPTAIRPRRTAALVTAVVLALMATACGTSNRAGSGGVSNALIGIALPQKTSSRWIVDGNNMVALFRAKGYRTDLRYGNDDVDEQVNQIQKMIDEGAKILVIAAIDNLALGDVLTQAASQGVKVIAYDRLILGTGHVDYYASFDNYKVGQLQADYIVDKLGLKKGRKGKKAGPFNIELFAGAPDDNNTRYFFNGAMDVLRHYLDKRQLVLGSGEKRLTQVNILRWDGAVAEDRMNQLLKDSYTDDRVDAVLSPYDGISRGVITALKHHGYGTSAKPLPVITGQDAEVDSVKLIISGQQSETVYKDSRELAQLAVTMADAMLTGRKVVVNDTTTYDNGNKVVPAYLLPPVSVDKTNYKKELVSSGYIKESDLR